MKTNLNVSIKTKKDAKKFIKELHGNNEAFHPDDDAFDIVFLGCNPTDIELRKLNVRISECHAVKRFDPGAYLFELLNN